MDEWTATCTSHIIKGQRQLVLIQQHAEWAVEMRNVYQGQKFIHIGRAKSNTTCGHFIAKEPYSRSISYEQCCVNNAP